MRLYTLLALFFSLSAVGQEDPPQFTNWKSYQSFFTLDELAVCHSYYEARGGEEKESIRQEMVAERLVDDTYIRWLSMSTNYVAVGMNKCELFATLGMRDPESRSRSTFGVLERYRYGSRTVYIQDGEVSAIYE